MAEVEFGSIKRITLPETWVAESEHNTTLMTLRSCYPGAHKDVEITFLRKKQNIDAASMQHFRDILAKPMHKIAEGSADLLQLTPVLGNAGNNQWSNKNRGADGPNFRLTSAETIFIEDRLVLQVKGSFIDPASKKAINEYCGLFIDSNSDATNNVVDEAYLQVPSHYGYFQFERYLKIFMDAIYSIEWV